MEFKITKEQIDKLASLGIQATMKKMFPEAFKKDLEVGKWYKLENNPSYLLNFQSKDKANNYGFVYWNWSSEWFFEDYHIGICQEATKEEISAALIAEAKKKGYKKGVTCLFGDAKDKRQLGTDCFFLENNTLYVKKKDSDNADIIFKDGIWADILPIEKTIITRERALKILAKKLKVSPENIEIE